MTSCPGPCAERVGAPDWLLDAAFAAVLISLAATFTLGPPWRGQWIALATHVFVSLYDGRFDRVRCATWLSLSAVWMAVLCGEMFGPRLTWNQASSWLAPRLPDPLAAWFWLHQRSLHDSAIIAALVLIIFGISDLVVPHWPRLRRSWRTRGIVVLVVVLIAVQVVFHPVAPRGQGPQPPAGDLPTGVLPFFSLLRAWPTKALGIASHLAFLALIASWPWRRAWRFHRAPTGPAFAILSLAAAAIWVGMGVLGTLPADGWVISLSRGLGLGEFCYLALALPVLAQFSRPPPSPYDAVF